VIDNHGFMLPPRGAEKVVVIEQHPEIEHATTRSPDVIAYPAAGASEAL
jgi:hypothetical protein